MSRWPWGGLSRASAQDRQWAECFKGPLQTALMLLGLWEGGLRSVLELAGYPEPMYKLCSVYSRTADRTNLFDRFSGQ